VTRLRGDGVTGPGAQFIDRRLSLHNRGARPRALEITRCVGRSHRVTAVLG
jgi:hypothetical protein